jgi:hypothetical protein
MIKNNNSSLKPETSPLFIGPEPPTAYRIIGYRTRDGSWMYDMNDFMALPLPQEVDFLREAKEKDKNINEYIDWWKRMYSIINSFEKKKHCIRSSYSIPCLFNNKKSTKHSKCWFCDEEHDGWYGPCKTCLVYIKTK